MARVLLINESNQHSLRLAQRLAALGFTVIEHPAEGRSFADLLDSSGADLIVYAADADTLAERDRMATLAPPEGQFPLLVIAEGDAPSDTPQ